MALGFFTEDGPRPELAEAFGAVELATADDRARTEQNVRDADASLWFGSVDMPGAKTTLWACEGMGRPHLIVTPRRGVKPSNVADWIRACRGIKVLNVAVHRESEDPGIGWRAERFLRAVFARIGHALTPGPDRRA